MSKFFKGEYTGYRRAKEVSSMKWWEKLLAIGSFAILLIAFALLFTANFFEAVICFCLSFIFIPIAMKIIFRDIPITVPAVFIFIGAAGLGIIFYIGKFGISGNDLPKLFVLGITSIFFLLGIFMLIKGGKANAQRRRFSIGVDAAVVDYKYKNANLGSPTEISNNFGRTTLVSPILEYVIDGTAYRGENDTYYGEQQVPAVGKTLHIYVNPKNYEEFQTKLQSGSMLTAAGMVFTLVAVIAGGVSFAVIGSVSAGNEIFTDVGSQGYYDNFPDYSEELPEYNFYTDNTDNSEKLRDYNIPENFECVYNCEYFVSYSDGMLDMTIDFTPDTELERFLNGETEKYYDVYNLKKIGFYESKNGRMIIVEGKFEDVYEYYAVNENDMVALKFTYDICKQLTAEECADILDTFIG